MYTSSQYINLVLIACVIIILKNALSILSKFHVKMYIFLVCYFVYLSLVHGQRTSTYFCRRATRHQASCFAQAANHSDHYVQPERLLKYKEFIITRLINRTAVRIVLCCSKCSAEY